MSIAIAVCLIAAPEVSAESDRATLAVLPSVLVAPGREAPPPRAFLEAVAGAIADRPRLRVLSEEELFVAGISPSSIDDCGADVACAASALRKGGVDFGVIVVVNLKVEPAMIALRMIDARASVIAGEEVKLLSGAATPLAEEVRARAASLFERAGFPKVEPIAIATPAIPPAEPTSLWSSPWLWVGVGVAALSIGAIVFGVTHFPGQCACLGLNCGSC